MPSVARQSLPLVVLAVTACLVVSLLAGCDKQGDIATNPPVTYDDGSGNVTIPGATILFEGNEYYENAQMADSCMAMVVTADSSLYLYSPLQKTLDSLTTTTAKEALLRTILYRLGTHGSVGEFTTRTGVRLNQYSDLWMELANIRHRWVGVRRISPQGQDKDKILPAASFFEFSTVELLQQHWSEVVSINSEPSVDMEYIYSDPPDTFKFFGAVSRMHLVMALPGSQMLARLLGLMPADFLTSWAQAYQDDPMFMARVETADMVDMLLFLVEAILGSEAASALSPLVGAALDGALSTVLISCQAIASAESREELLTDLGDSHWSTFLDFLLGSLGGGLMVSSEPDGTSPGYEPKTTSLIGTIQLIKTLISLGGQGLDLTAGAHDAITNLPYDKFVPEEPDNFPPLKPNPPSGPTSGEVGVQYDFTVVTTDPEGEDVSYQVDFGEQIAEWSGYYPSGEAATVSYAWSNAGAYDMKVRAKDINENISSWSNAHPITITDPGGNNPPNAPVAPSGPSAGTVGTSYTFSSSTTDPDGDRVQIQFDWGDGTLSSWSALVSGGSTVQASKSWSTANTYSVKAHAKDEHGAQSGWSPVHSITITTGGGNNPPNDPAKPSGPTSGYVGTSYTFSTSGTDPDGDSVQFKFSWDGGSSSNWTSLVPSGGSGSKSYAWPDTGHYQVIAQTRDKPGLTSDWSQPHTITIHDTTGGNRPPNTPSTPSGDTWGQVGKSYSFTTSAIDPDGDRVKLRFAWGDGDTSDWSSYRNSGSEYSKSHTYEQEGTYSIRSQAEDANGAKSGWSTAHQIEISKLGTLKWEFWTYDGISAAAALSSGGVLYFVTDDTLFAMSTAGNILWCFGPRSYLEDAPTVGSDGTVYIGTSGVTVCSLYAVNPNGTVKWKRAGWVKGSVALGSDGTIYYPTSLGKFVALYPDGRLKWEVESGGISPVVGSDGTVYYAGDDSLYARNSSGTRKWARYLGASCGSTPAIGADGTVYVGSDDNQLHAFRPDGSTRWTHRIGTDVRTSPCIGADGTVYFSADSLYALDPSTGARQWAVYIYGNSRYCGGLAVAADGTIYAGAKGTNYGYLVAVTASGEIRWRFTCHPGTSVRVPVIGSDGTLYFGDSWGNFYAVYGSAPLANTAWPTYQHDHKRTGRVGGGK